MTLTLEKLLKSESILQAVISKILKTEADKIYWKKYLKFEETRSRMFKTYFGTYTGVTMGSVIDRNSNKPLRERRTLGQGYGEVAFMGNKYQFDNDRLDMLNELTKRFSDGDNKTALKEIIDYLTDDMRQLTLAPHKRMDYVLGQLRSTGKANVTVDDNKNGISVLEMELPVKNIVATSADKDSLIEFIKDKIEGLRTSVGSFEVMEMSRKTFNKRILASQAFQDTYKVMFGNSQVALKGGLLTAEMTNQLFTGVGLPPIRIIDEYVMKEDGTNVNSFADDKIALLPSMNLGKMRWHLPYEATDPVPTKVYTRLEGGHIISSKRTEEGRFLEYSAEWIPEITAADRIAIIDTEQLG